MAAEAGFVLRPLGAEDAAAYRRLRLEGLERHPELFRVSHEDEVLVAEETFAERLRASYTLGGFCGGELSGVGSIAPFAGSKLKHKALLYAMYVRREAGGLGLGEAIVRSLLAEAQVRYDSVQLTVAAENSRARALYERCGFRWYAREPRSICAGGAFLDEDLLWCPMGSDLPAR